MNHSDSLPLFERGFGRVKLALKSTLKRAPRSSPTWLGEQPAWRDDLLSQGYNVSGTRTLDQLGYAHSPHKKIAVDTITGVAVVQRLFTAEGVAVLQDICSRLEQGAGDSDWIISRRTRGVTALSPFLNDMMCSRAFLLAVSRIAGVPLVPYPMLNARSQINYFYPKPAEQQQQLGMWHTDGTNYVLNIVLSDRSDFSGGEFLFHNGTVDTFDALDYRTFETARLDQPGDALFIYGSRLFHGVRPVLSGRRMSLVLSFHCPCFSDDSNRFWHLASDDGIATTIPNWLGLHWALRRSAARQYARIGIEPITFEELHNTGA
ncbi:2OG-Fe(II) oxygenase [Pseudomonas putida]|uniref:2OG-Fe(II) oxygenase n=1 Tax=Pseudomonas TaxID=286 RepID=UPI00137807B7|nr:2OG-Fe(II) oxygenase [Pseudomonas putida]NBA81272.1 2OG-Fe(II) oxygenase [Pseudomonas putida]